MAARAFSLSVALAAAIGLGGDRGGAHGADTAATTVTCKPNVLTCSDACSIATAWDAGCQSLREFQPRIDQGGATPETTLDLSRLNLVGVNDYPSVTTLLLSHNFLGAFKPAKTDVTLRRLDMSWNSLASLNNLTLPATLISLDLSHNSIVAIDTSAAWPITLKQLSLESNPIQSLTSSVWSTLTSLSNLSLANVDLTTTNIDLSTIQLPPSLDNLNLSQMGLTSFQHIPALSALRSLDLSGNKLTAFPAQLPSSLTTLTLASNAISNLQGLEYLPKLSKLNVRGNPLKEIQVSSAGFAVLSNLTEFLVSKEMLSSNCSNASATPQRVRDVTVCVLSATTQSGNISLAPAASQAWSRTAVVALSIMACVLVAVVAVVLIMRRRAPPLEWPPPSRASKNPADTFAQAIAPTAAPPEAASITTESWIYSNRGEKPPVPILEERSGMLRSHRVPEKLVDLMVFEIPLNELRVSRMLSSGASDHQLLYLAEYQGYEAVLYVTLAHKLPRRRREGRTFIEQVRLTANLEHLSLVQFLGVLFGNKRQHGSNASMPKWKLGVLLEYMHLGSLEHLFVEERNRRDGRRYVHCPSTLDALSLQSVRGDLFSWAPKSAGPDASRRDGDWRCKLSIALDVAMALVYLHSVNVVHGNLCARTVLINEQGEAKLSAMDINLATNMALRASAMSDEDAARSTHQSANTSSRRRNIFGEDNSISQSVDFGSSLMGQDPTKRGNSNGSARSSARASRRMRAQMDDVYAFGLLLWELDTMMSIATMQRQLAIAAAMLEPGKQHNLLKFSSECPSEIQFIARRCWHPDLKKRPTALELQEDLVRLLEAQLGFHGDRSAASSYRWSQRTRPSIGSSSEVLMSEPSLSLGTVPSETEV